jgi:hypothetical protein
VIPFLSGEAKAVFLEDADERLVRKGDELAVRQPGPARVSSRRDRFPAERSCMVAVDTNVLNLRLRACGGPEHRQLEPNLIVAESARFSEMSRLQGTRRKAARRHFVAGKAAR